MLGAYLLLFSCLISFLFGQEVPNKPKPINQTKWNLAFEESIAIRELAKFYRSGYISTDMFFDDVLGEARTERLDLRDVRGKTKIVDLFEQVRKRYGDLITAEILKYSKVESSLVWASFTWFFTNGRMLQMYTKLENAEFVASPYKYKIKAFTISDWVEGIQLPKRIATHVATLGGNIQTFWKNASYESNVKMRGVTKVMHTMLIHYFNNNQWEDMLFSPKIQLSWTMPKSDKIIRSDGKLANVIEFFKIIKTYAGQGHDPSLPGSFINIYNVTGGVFETVNWWRVEHIRMKSRLTIFHKPHNLSYPWSYEQLDIYTKEEKLYNENNCPDQYHCDS